ncbi:MAG: L-histidine N(alpha)-methyltransferase [Dehalococcoidia bacterium]|nr:L-histidine N(alpha)-methyltransferase [Dehalococcoidia bacterium]
MHRSEPAAGTHGVILARGDDDPVEADLRRAFLEDAWDGLGRPQKTLPSKYFYDEVGSVLFDRICELDEYYVTRTEMTIMREHGAQMADRLGPACMILEYGSGSSTKTYCLLEHLEPPALYVPVDVAREHLLAAAERIAVDFPLLDVAPVCADFTGDFTLPQPEWAPQRRIVYFPGSTIGNFTRDGAADILARIVTICGPGGGLLIGVDLRKPAEVLEPAYDDPRGVTAAFNLNLLARINAELGGDFDRSRFRHRACWNERHGRIEMHLECLADHIAHVGGRAFQFRRGETILTEYSHKYTPQEFASLARAAGLQVRDIWTDSREWFAVLYLEIADQRER